MELDNVINLCMQKQTSKDSQENNEKDKLWGGLMVSDTKTYYKATIIKAVWYWDMNKESGKNKAKKLT